ncbi:M48 family metallopeptidase [Variovorax sp. PBL-E5]|uniref:M48 family metallopeptidase n=1 Tax=Variovorax sp. PBL-E5 TaxID=434014 RepID=UPI001317DE9D|nr:SprT family zinc-dependent metalloprotease [Variovorax sp. PBL-E5]VTU40278.1 hypothetical protein E5CHR_05436 [Variovorax sp. PBL-E5]
MNAPSSRSFRYGDELIRFRVRTQPARKARRIAIHVEPDGSVVVDAPQDADDTAVIAAVRQRAAWISQRVADIRQRLDSAPAREHVSGESLLYLGRRYQLKVVADAPRHGSVRMRGAHIEVAAARPDAAQVHAMLDAWYALRAREVMASRLAAVAAPLRWVHALPAVRLRAMRRQWGNCSPAGRLTLNPHLVKAPRECIDYVILHELCHLKEHHHGPRFHRLLDACMPGWREVKKRLDGLVDQLMPLR